MKGIHTNSSNPAGLNNENGTQAGSQEPPACRDTHSSTHTCQNCSASAFSNAKFVKISGEPQFTTVAGNQEIHYNGSSAACPGLESLKPRVACNAFYNHCSRDPQTQCHPSTREMVMERIEEWANSGIVSEHSALLWLNGPAGVGKSAIAQTIAKRLDEAGKLAATFFFSRTDPACNNADRFFTTLAWQIAHHIPETKAHIAKALGDDPYLLTKSTEVQFSTLLAEPFKHILERSRGNLTSKRVVIIDGLDECDNESMQARILQILVDSVIKNKTILLFLVCSRPELHIQNSFGEHTHNGSAHAFRNPLPLPHMSWSYTLYSTIQHFLQSFVYHLRSWGQASPIFFAKACRALLNVREYPRRIAFAIDWGHERFITFQELLRLCFKEAKDQPMPDPEGIVDQRILGGRISRIAIGVCAETEQGIETYLRDHLKSISLTRNIDPNSWLSDKVVERLVKNSSGQFLYASVVITFVYSEEDPHPWDALMPIINSQPTRAKSSPFSPLDQLYIEILSRQQDQAFLKNFLAVLLTLSSDIHFKNIPQNTHIIEGLLGLQEGSVFVKLRRMHSLLRISPDSIKVYHISFLEFIQGSIRSSQYHMTRQKALSVFLYLLITSVMKYAFKTLMRSE